MQNCTLFFFSFTSLRENIDDSQFSISIAAVCSDRFSKLMLISQVLSSLGLKFLGKFSYSRTLLITRFRVWCGGKSVRTTYCLMCFCTAVDAPYLLFFFQFTFNLFLIFDLRLGNFSERSNEQILWDNSLLLNSDISLHCSLESR